MARVYFKVHAKDIRKAVQEKGVKNIIALSKNPNVMKQIAGKAIDLITPYVPKDSGALQESAHVIYHEKQVQIVWGDKKIGARGNPTEKYARYQYEGEVYGPNIPIRVNGILVGWRSPKGEGSKYPTGRRLTYKSPTAMAHWTDAIKRGTKEFNELVAYAEPLMKKEIKHGNQ